MVAKTEARLRTEASAGGSEYVVICQHYAELEGQYTIEQLEAVIELLKRAQA